MEAILQQLLEAIVGDNKLGQFLCVLARSSCFLMLTPIFAQNQIPVILKAFFCFTFAVIITPFVPQIYEGSMITEVIFQSLIGLLLGMLTRFIYEGVVLGANLMATQMGLSYANIMNPTTNDQSSAIAVVYSLAVITLFLSINGHYVLFLGLMKSFQSLDSHILMNTESMIAIISALVQDAFEICIRVALPMIITILFLHIGMGLLSKAVPQMNAFAMSLSINILVALVILFIGNREVLSINQEWINGINDIFAKAMLEGQ